MGDRDPARHRSLPVREPVKRETLRRYQKAVQRSMEKGAPMPLRLSEYLSGKKSAPARSGRIAKARCIRKKLGSVPLRWSAFW
jgi:hypothetical protein